MTFSATLDNWAKLITAFFLSLTIFGFTLPFYICKPISLTFPFIIFIVAVLVYSNFYLLMPLNYVISNGNIIISRRRKTIILTEENIIGVQLYQSSLLKKQGYISGVKGMFGYTGKTYLNGVGILRWYGTRKDKKVLITTRDHRKIIITPDQPDEFVEAFSKNLT